MIYVHIKKQALWAHLVLWFDGLHICLLSNLAWDQNTCQLPKYAKALHQQVKYAGLGNSNISFFTYLHKFTIAGNTM